MRRVICSSCGISFLRYSISAARAARPQFCTRECQNLFRSKATKNDLEHRLWQRISKSGDNDCWHWTARRDPNGYGRLDVDGRPMLAHRLVYKSAHGDPGGFVVRHACDTPSCCNPRHLLIGTQVDNVRDMDDRGRRRPGTLRGERSLKAKLTAEQALEIFRSSEPLSQLAARYGVTETAIRLIKSGKNWAHVTRPFHAA